MRDRLLHETTSRLELAALQKADAVAGPVHLLARAKASQDASMSLDPADTIELTETLDFIAGWLASDSACRRGGALALRPDDLDAGQCLIRLREKGETVRLPGSKGGSCRWSMARRDQRP